MSACPPTLSDSIAAACALPGSPEQWACVLRAPQSDCITGLIGIDATLLRSVRTSVFAALVARWPVLDGCSIPARKAITPVAGDVLLLAAALADGNFGSGFDKLVRVGASFAVEAAQLRAECARLSSAAPLPCVCTRPSGVTGTTVAVADTCSTAPSAALDAPDSRATNSTLVELGCAATAPPTSVLAACGSIIRPGLTDVAVPHVSPQRAVEPVIAPRAPAGPALDNFRDGAIAPAGAAVISGALPGIAIGGDAAVDSVAPPGAAVERLTLTGGAAPCTAAIAPELRALRAAAGRSATASASTGVAVSGGHYVTPAQPREWCRLMVVYGSCHRFSERQLAVRLSDAGVRVASCCTLLSRDSFAHRSFRIDLDRPAFAQLRLLTDSGFFTRERLFFRAWRPSLQSARRIAVSAPPDPARPASVTTHTVLPGERVRGAARSAPAFVGPRLAAVSSASYARAVAPIGSTFAGARVASAECSPARCQLLGELRALREHCAALLGEFGGRLAALPCSHAGAPAPQCVR